MLWKGGFDVDSPRSVKYCSLAVTAIAGNEKWFSMTMAAYDLSLDMLPLVSEDISIMFLLCMLFLLLFVPLRARRRLAIDLSR